MSDTTETVTRKDDHGHPHTWERWVPTCDRPGCSNRTHWSRGYCPTCRGD